MTPHQFVAIAVRLFSIWLTVWGMSIAILASTWVRRDMVNESFIILAAFAIMVIAVCLWLFPLAVAHKLAPKTNQDNTLKVAPLDVAAVGCFFVGLLALVTGLANLAGSVGVSVILVGSGETLRNMPSDELVNAMLAAVQFALGLFLVGKCRVMARHVARKG